MTEDETQGSSTRSMKEIENRLQRADRRRSSARWSTRSNEVLDKKELKDPTTGKPLGAATRTTSSSPSRPQTFKLDDLDIRSPEQQEAGREDLQPALASGSSAVIDEQRPQAELA